MRSISDTDSKNGNLLLNVGQKREGIGVHFTTEGVAAARVYALACEAA